MIIRKALFLLILSLSTFSCLHATSLDKILKEQGYIEIYDQKDKAATFTALYTAFDEFVAFFQKNPAWAQKLHNAKERFIRSKDRKYYSTDFFGLYDESKKEGRKQISFYYSIHFHEFICSRYPKLYEIPELFCFFEMCQKIQAPYRKLFTKIATELGLEPIFSSEYGHPPILFKVIKYLPTHKAHSPHYDGTAFSLFLDSTDNSSLLFSPYKPSFQVEDFFSPVRTSSDSILLIPGAFLTEYSIYPTPHIILQNGKTRYATIAFAMRPDFIFQKNEFSPLPNFKD